MRGAFRRHPPIGDRDPCREGIRRRGSRLGYKASVPAGADHGTSLAASVVRLGVRKGMTTLHPDRCARFLAAPCLSRRPSLRLFSVSFSGPGMDPRGISGKIPSRANVRGNAAPPVEEATPLAGCLPGPASMSQRGRHSPGTRLDQGSDSPSSRRETRRSRIGRNFGGIPQGAVESARGWASRLRDEGFPRSDCRRDDAFTFATRLPAMWRRAD
jgi:hypothetical protein